MASSAGNALFFPLLLLCLAGLLIVVWAARARRLGWVQGGGQKVVVIAVAVLLALAGRLMLPIFIRG
jgi:hypothetical protein